MIEKQIIVRLIKKRESHGYPKGTLQREVYIK